MIRLHQIAMECAPLLKGQWRYLKNEESNQYRIKAVLQDDTERGRQIIFSDYYLGEGRIKISGSYPDRYVNHFKITCSESRPIPALSADINRRFLPKYLTAYEAAKNRYQIHQDKQEKLQIQVDLVKQIMPSMSPYQNYRDDLATDYYFQNGKLRFNSYKNDVSLEINLSFEKLIQVLYILKQDT